MRLTIESTAIIAVLDGRPARLWRGTTAGGRPVDVFVALIATDDPAAVLELEMGLANEVPCPAGIRAYVEAEIRR